MTTEFYKGRTIALEFRPAVNEKHYTRSAQWAASSDGDTHYDWWIPADGVNAEQAWRKLAPRVRRAIDQAVEDEQLRDRLIALAHVNTDGLVTSDEPAKVGDTAVVYSRGRDRVGVVTKVTRTGTVTVAYTTPSNPGYVTRKTAKVGEYQTVK